MADDTWTGGYVVDVEYTHGFYPELAPLNLAMAATLAGRRAVDPDQPFTYLELGCGNGYSTALLAAGHPHAQFWANDFNPAHIQNARATAQAAGLDNVTFLEASFEAMLDADLPAFDIIVMHGIWSWVSAENRHYIVELLRRRLKPGGLVYVSYNCLPGWSRTAPLRKLMKLGVTDPSAPARQRVDQALGFARALRDAGGGYFAATPEAGAMLDRLAKENPIYLSHEYLHDQWWLFYQDEVADSMAPARLAYVAQARLMEGFDQFNFTAAQRTVLAGKDGRLAPEVTRDFLLDRRFRRDIYGRGAEPLTPAEISQWMSGRRFALARLRNLCPLKFKRPGGEFNLTPQVFDGVLDGLMAGPATVAQLCALPALQGTEARHVEQALGVLCGLSYIQPALDPAGDAARKAVTDRFNAAAVKQAASGKPVAALASPVTGTGIPLPAPEQVFLAATLRGRDPEELVDAMTVDSDEQREALRGRARNFAGDGVAALRTLQVI